VRRKRLRLVAVAAMIAAGAAAVIIWRVRTEAAQPSTARPASAAELALIAPLTVGSPLEDYQVREVHAVENGFVRVVCARDGAVVQLDIALGGGGGPNRALASAGQYSIYYSLQNAPDADGQKLAKALAAAMQPNGALPPPPGLTTFEPKPAPH
jgi:hypothetical protein